MKEVEDIMVDSKDERSRVSFQYFVIRIVGWSTGVNVCSMFSNVEPVSP